MVRLKENVHFFRVGVQVISIPYGAIKSSFQRAGIRGYRLFQFHMVRLKVVLANWKGISVVIFQFHMVRLKGLIAQIGRENGVFQFHMVRLKAFAGRLSTPSCRISIPYGAIKRQTKM